MNEMLDYALEYARMGMAVFPVNRLKKPYIINGFLKATTDEAQIETWWNTWPDANIGIATGKLSNGICVIDLDLDEEKGKNGIKTLRDWEALHGTFPPSWLAITGRGGWHYYFKADEEVKCRINMLPGIDIRGDGGYIVAPPSIHSNGNQYRWSNNLSPYEIPIQLMDDNIKYLLHHQDTALKPVYVAPDKIPEGERNGMLFKFACMMQSKGVSDQTVFAATKSENETKCNPPLSEKEVYVIVKSALRYEKGKPIYVKSDMTAVQGQREPVFDLDNKGKIKKTLDNVREAIEYDVELYEHIKFNVLTNNLFVFGELPWEKKETYRPWKNSDDANLKSYLERRYGFTNTENIMDALLIVGELHKFNPVIDELEKIHKEKGACEGAIRKLLPEYMGAEDSDYNYEVMKVYMLGAISRAYYPGCKFDYSLILYGPQGFGKSEFLRHLAICSEWFNDNFNTFEGDKAIEKISGMWIIEMAELKALKSSKDSETFKAFLTSRVDTYRAPYSRRSEQRPRMCVFAGTTNNKNVFVDKTGNRRFLPVEAKKGNETKNLFGDQEAVMEDFKKAWSEAMDIFLKSDKKPSLILPKEAQLVAEKMQREFSEEDYRIGVIQNWLDETDSYKVCVPQLIEYALEGDVNKMNRMQQREIMDIMDNEIKGWIRLKNKDRNRTTFKRYGKQTAFIREPK